MAGAKLRFNDPEKVALVRHVKWSLEGDPRAMDLAAVEPHGDDIYPAIAAGVVLGLFIRHVDEVAVTTLELHDASRPMCSLHR